MSAAANTELENNDTPVRTRRSRGFPRPWRLWFVSLLLTVAFCAFVGFLALAIYLPIKGDKIIGVYSLVCLVAFIMARLSAFILARGMNCTLCHGTVVSERKCRKHVDAVRIPPLSYRATAALSSLFTLSFRCMYCGSRYRLWK